MAGFTRVHGAVAPFEAVGRNLFFKNLAKGSAMSQADLDALTQTVSQLVTIARSISLASMRSHRSTEGSQITDNSTPG